METKHIFPKMDARLRTVKTETGRIENQYLLETLVRVKSDQDVWFLVPVIKHGIIDLKSSEFDVMKHFIAECYFVLACYILPNKSVREQCRVIRDDNQQDSESERIKKICQQ